MALLTLVKKGLYQDSVKLMLLSKRLKELPGVQEATAVMATATNLDVLKEVGLLTETASEAEPEDIVIVVKAESEQLAREALGEAERDLSGENQRTPGAGQATREIPRTLAAACRIAPKANLALISVPGRYAAREARKALESGLNVMLFSDNVSLADEIDLKKLAREKDLLVMGPDCGTVILNGVALGFGNAVRRGPIGIIGASGTGIQEVSVLIDRYGSGISQALGTGGRDLKREVGGISMLSSIDILDADTGTGLLLLISKPPDPEVARLILERARQCRKPVIVNFLGQKPENKREKNVFYASTLEEAALLAVRLAEGRETGPDETAAVSPELAAPLTGEQKYIRGLYTGGTLAYETLVIFKEELEELHSNITLAGVAALDNPWRGCGNSIIDLGDDALTQGRPHPMIDPEIRNRLVLQEARDPAVAVLLLDVVTGFGSHPDPGGILAPVICQARAAAAEAGRNITVLAHVCGTESDPQIRSKQEAVLQEAGAVLCETNARMASTALQIVKKAGK